MSKDRNTIAKRQREMEKKRKAEQKREIRAKKKKKVDEGDEPGESREADDSQHFLSLAEEAVLSVFRKYLMTPGEMLCFGSSELEAYTVPLAQLIDKGLLVEERFRGGYSLTETGFAPVRDGQ